VSLCPSLCLRCGPGSAVAHWVEMGEWDGAGGFALIHPALPLERGAWYMVLVRGLTDSRDGRLLPKAPGLANAQRDFLATHDRDGEAAACVFSSSSFSSSSASSLTPSSTSNYDPLSAGGVWWQATLADRRRGRELGGCSRRHAWRQQQQLVVAVAVFSRGGPECKRAVEGAEAFGEEGPRARLAVSLLPLNP